MLKLPAALQAFANALEREGVTLERLPLGHDGIETAALQRSTADVLHISPYRSFPSGVTASASKRAFYLQWAAKGERWIVEDDFESEFSVSKKYEETLFAHSHRNCVIYLNTFSGTISPALRMGYMVVPPQLLGKLETLTDLFSCTVPVPDQAVVAQLLQSGDYNVTEAAMMPGFNQMAHFRETFKKEFGVNPSDVMKSKQKR